MFLLLFHIVHEFFNSVDCIVLKRIQFSLVTCWSFPLKDNIFHRTSHGICITKVEFVMFIARRIHEFHFNLISIIVNIHYQSTIPYCFTLSDYHIGTNFRQLCRLVFFKFRDKEVIMSWVVEKANSISRLLICFSKMCAFICSHVMHSNRSLDYMH